MLGDDGSIDTEQLGQRLLRQSDGLVLHKNIHFHRPIRRGVEEELVRFVHSLILTRPAPEMSADERAEVKKVARDLLNRLKKLLVLNWRAKSSARSQLKLAIEGVLDAGLPRIYTPEIYQQKCSALFEHVYESYPERDVGVYAEAR